MIDLSEKPLSGPEPVESKKPYYPSITIRGEAANAFIEKFGEPKPKQKFDIPFATQCCEFSQTEDGPTIRFDLLGIEGDMAEEEDESAEESGESGASEEAASSEPAKGKKA